MAGQGSAVQTGSLYSTDHSQSLSPKHFSTRTYLPGLEVLLGLLVGLCSPMPLFTFGTIYRDLSCHIYRQTLIEEEKNIPQTYHSLWLFYSIIPLPTYQPFIVILISHSDAQPFRCCMPFQCCLPAEPFCLAFLLLPLPAYALWIMPFILTTEDKKEKQEQADFGQKAKTKRKNKNKNKQDAICGLVPPSLFSHTI